MFRQRLDLSKFNDHIHFAETYYQSRGDTYLALLFKQNHTLNVIEQAMLNWSTQRLM